MILDPAALTIRKFRPALTDAGQQRRFIGWILAAFMLIVALAPLPLGSNRMWASSLVSAWTCLLLSLLLVAWLIQPRLIITPMRKTLMAALVLQVLVIIWIILQTSSLTPESWHHPLWRETVTLLQKQGFKDAAAGGSIALDPAASRAALVRLIGYCASFWLAYFLALDSLRARLMLGAIIVIGLAYAAYGFVVQASGSNLVLWFPKRAYINNMTSTFFNRNSYAAYAGLGMLCGAALLFERWRRAWRESSLRFFWRDFLTQIGGGEIMWLLPPLMLLIALVLSASRGGFVSSMAGLFVLAVGYAINKKVRRTNLFLAAGLVPALMLITLLVGGSELVARMQSDVVTGDLPLRTNVYVLTIEAIKANPWLGYGYGNFDTAFRLFRDATVDGWYEQAHDEYLEMAMDLGIPAAIMWFTAVGLILSRCVHGMLRRKRDGIYPVLALAATTLFALHSTLDFSLQIPAIAVTYAVILGMGVAQSWSTRDFEAVT